MIDANYLRERLDYNPLTGIFIWKDHPDFPLNWKAIYTGQVAGGINNQGYILIRFNRKKEKAHRLASIHVHGSIPDDMLVDHIDGNRANNALSNIRLATYSQNSFNQGLCHRNKSGVKNVFLHSSGKWQVQIRMNHQSYFFGTYSTVEEAAAVAKVERDRLHGDFARAS